MQRNLGRINPGRTPDHPWEEIARGGREYYGVGAEAVIDAFVSGDSSPPHRARRKSRSTPTASFRPTWATATCSVKSDARPSNSNARRRDMRDRGVRIPLHHRRSDRRPDDNPCVHQRGNAPRPAASRCPTGRGGGVARDRGRTQGRARTHGRGPWPSTTWTRMRPVRRRRVRHRDRGGIRRPRHRGHARRQPGARKQHDRGQSPPAPQPRSPQQRQGQPARSGVRFGVLLGGIVALIVVSASSVWSRVS